MKEQLDIQVPLTKKEPFFRLFDKMLAFANKTDRLSTKTQLFSVQFSNN